MDNTSAAPGAQGIDRREAIRRATLLAGAAFAPAWLALVDRGAASAQAAGLSSGQLALVAAVAERILPRSDTPGATDVGVPAFINTLYAQFLTDAERTLLSTGLQSVEAACLAAHGTGFASATATQQDGVLRSVAVAEQPQPQGFFRMIRSATILGYFTSEQVGRNVLHYDPVPGRYEACVPISEVGNRNWTT